MNSEPPREKLLERLEAVSEQLVKSIASVVECTVKTCITCENFDEDKEQCGLNGLRPPARIIAFGCECWEDRIPF